jgi:hypothetical protein
MASKTAPELCCARGANHGWMKMNRYEAYHKFFTLPVIGVFSHMIGRRDRSLRELSDHILKDIGISRSEVLSLAEFRGGDSTRRRRR